MDHASAHLMEFTNSSLKTTVTTSKFTHHVKEMSLGKSEILMHNKERHQQAEYYADLGKIIKEYNEVVILGPTDAKAELVNSLRVYAVFDDIKLRLYQRIR